MGLEGLVPNRTVNLKTVNMCYYTTQVFAHHTCAEDGYLKRPLGRILAEKFGRIGGWFVVGLGFGGVVSCVPRIKSKVKFG
jgi:hypothetical protein